MHFVSFIVAAAALVSASHPGFVSVPVEKVKVPRNSTVSKFKAAITHPIQDVLGNAAEQYVASFSVGTPPQYVKASIDTGSSDLWLYESGATYDYDPSKSNTSEYINGGFSISYVDGTTALGDYFKDILTWGPASVKTQFAINIGNDDSWTIGLNDKDVITQLGVFGIGFIEDEASWGGLYQNYPYSLKDAGYISSVSYSLYLDSHSKSTGSLLFGAIDTSRYTGPLGIVPVLSDTSFAVNVSVNNHSFVGILDAGTTFTYVPPEVANSIAESLGATLDPTLGFYQAPEVLPDQGVVYDFSGTKVTVPPSELWFYSNNRTWLSITSTDYSSGYVLLGDTFLHSAYVVYDLENKSIGIAQAEWNPGPSHYEIIGSDGIKA